MLDAVLQNLDTLANSIQKYGLRHTDSTTGSTNYDIKNDVIFFNIRAYDTPNFVHETTHGQQFQNGGIVFRRIIRSDSDTLADGVGDDIDDELQAYKAQFAFDPSSVSNLQDTSSKVKSLEDITSRWLLGLKDAKGRVVYKINGKNGLAQAPVNIRSDKRALMNAYPLADNWRLVDSNYILGNDTNFLNFPAKLRQHR